MLKPQIEAPLAKVIGVGAFITTIMVGAWWGTDPVNVPKLFTLAIMAGSGLGILLVGFNKRSLRASRGLLFAVMSFLIFSLVATIFSTEPVVTSFYGVFGRNNGFLSYFSFVILFFLVAQFQDTYSVKILLKSFYFAGLFNVAYCALSILGVELIPWNNIFNTILGTFGNPNFIGAFLGMFASYLFGLLLSKEYDLKSKAFNFIVLIVTCYEILYSNAIQGIVVTAIGCAVAAFFFIRANSKSKFILVTYSFSVLAVSVVSALGALQIGPLAKLIYKPSVSLRGEYWQAGLNMGFDRPFFGVGMDSYGAWFRQSRDESALIFPGADTTSNAAHNVALDLFASGGFPLLISYLAILCFTLLSIYRVMWRMNQFDVAFVSLVSLWIGFQAQSVISINQIGLAIWGWIFGGLIIGYERALNPKEGTPVTKSGYQTKSAGKGTVKQVSQPSTVLAGFVGALVGGLIALPPLAADVNWRAALGSGSQEQLEKSLTRFPASPNRLSEGVKIFSQNNLPDVARKYAITLTESYPDNFISWASYAQLVDLTEAEKNLILKNLSRLDPLNPKFITND